MKLLTFVLLLLRGVQRESGIHLKLLCRELVHLDIARFLVNVLKFPNLIKIHDFYRCLRAAEISPELKAKFLQPLIN